VVAYSEGDVSQRYAVANFVRNGVGMYETDPATNVSDIEMHLQNLVGFLWRTASPQ
jgi:hypothetical protein